MKYLKTYRLFESSDDMSFEEIRQSLDNLNIDYKINDFEKIGLIHVQINEKSSKVDKELDYLCKYMESEGYETFVNKAIRVQINVYFYLPSSKNHKQEEFFINYISELRRVDNPKEYPDSIVWVDKENMVIFNQDKKNEWFWTFYDGFWEAFKSEFLMSGLETQEFIRYMVGKHLKLEALIPTNRSFRKFNRVGKHLKLEALIPEHIIPYDAPWVGKHLKLEALTPKLSWKDTSQSLGKHLKLETL